MTKGNCWKYGDNVNTDEIIPARYLNTTSEKELGSHCMEDIDRDFIKKVKPGDIVVAGENFGCGSSREHAPVALRGAGVACVIGKSFARIFFRNAINTGLAIVECPEAVDAIATGDEAAIDFSAGTITVNKKKFKIEPFPVEIQKIMEAGGLMNLVKQRVGQ
jgi:3-isopropylmalate/(R)-2-methylmalate dehydratase small subunit